MKKYFLFITNAFSQQQELENEKRLVELAPEQIQSEKCQLDMKDYQLKTPS